MQLYAALCSLKLGLYVELSQLVFSGKSLKIQFI